MVLLTITHLRCLPSNPEHTGLIPMQFAKDLGEFQEAEPVISDAE